MTAERIPKSDKDLWQSLSLDRNVSRAAVSDLDFAAWLEGRLSEPSAARIDAAVTHDPELRAAALELADTLGKPLPSPPLRIVARAQALVGFPSERSLGSKSGMLGMWLAVLLPSFGGDFALRRGVMAGLAVIIAAIGFVMGGGLGQSFAEQKYASAESTIAVPRSFGADTSHQLNDLFTDSI
jgi:hypothetical protein